MAFLSLSEGILIFVTLAGPILAVQTQKLIERLRENRERKLRIFNILMATRAARLSPGHVEALNMIDIVFHGNRAKDKAVIESWRLYHDHLKHLKEPYTQEELNSWSEKGNDIFIELLYSMAQALNYDFDRVLLKRGIYTPKAHSENELAQIGIRDSLLKVLSGEQPLPMSVVSFLGQDRPYPSPPPQGNDNSQSPAPTS